MNTVKIKTKSKIHDHQPISMESDSEREFESESQSQSESDVILGQTQADDDDDNDDDKDNDYEVTTNDNDCNSPATKPNQLESKYLWIVPWILAIHRLTFATGAGMTVKFFVIFFEEKLLFDPIPVCLIWFIMPLIVSIMALFTPKLAQKFGSVTFLITFKSISIVCLVIMGIYAQEINGYSQFEKYLISIVFMARNTFVRSVRPIEKGIVMDIVDEKNRGKWSSIESLNRGIWTFSAALGGYLIDKYGFQAVFFVTATVYSVGVLELIPLCFIVVTVRANVLEI